MDNKKAHTYNVIHKNSEIMRDWNVLLKLIKKKINNK